jgi:hypothetical protein
MGLFHIPKSDTTRALKIIACGVVPETQGWEHVSVSMLSQPRSIPTWDEMCLVKRLFWEPEDCVVQFHPPASRYVNTNAGVLHPWRLAATPFPMPPIDLV